MTVFIFFVKQKTAYEMRISDWSSDVCSSDLPAFLAPNPGINSGFMIAQVTAAALASENKQRAHPASIDTIPTSANQEDHVSMAAHAAYRLLAMAENLAGILGVEYLCAVQGIDLRAPLQTSAQLGAACALLRGGVALKIGRTSCRERVCQLVSISVE